MFTLEVNYNIRLRILETQDAPELFALVDANREHLRRWFPWVDRTKSPDDSRTFISNTLKALAEGSEIHCGIQYGNELAGIIGTLPIDWNSKEVTMGYWLGEKFQGKGILTSAGNVFLDHLFGKLGLNRAVIKYFTENERSRRVAERLGFTREGILREGYMHYGNPVDIVCTSMLRREWEFLRKNKLCVK